MMPGMSAPVNPKSLVMLDATGKVATLKLTTATGLHVYDGSTLWVNPAPAVAAAAPLGLGAASPTAPPGGHKPTKALPIVDPKTGDELVLAKPESAPASPQPAPQPAAAVAPLQSSALASFPTVPAMLAQPAAQAGKQAPGPKKGQNILDLLARATVTTPAALMPLLSTPMPQVGGRGRGRDRDLEDRDRPAKGGRGGKGSRPAPEGRGKGRGTRPAAATTEPRAKKSEAGQYPGEKYTKDAKYTASLDGRFWSLSVWPTGERDQEHRLTFGKHKLDVLPDGTVKVVLFGGVNRYKIRLHLATDGDELGANDKDGWGLASCEPSAANLQLTEEAEKLGWKIHKGGEHPLLLPPGVEAPAEEAKPEAKGEGAAEQS